MTQPVPGSLPGKTHARKAARAQADPTLQSRWRSLRLLQAAMEDDIARLYADARISGIKPNWVMELLRLHYRGPMTITELAREMERTHSAVSQKVAAMREAGLVTVAVGDDSRTRTVRLTPKARRIVPRLAAEWRATEAATAELELEIPYPLSQVVEDLRAALERTSFHDRIAARLAADGDWHAAGGAGDWP